MFLYRYSLFSSLSPSYSHPNQSISFVDPISGGTVKFPPCLVTPATSNRDYAKGSILDQRLLNPRAPSTACFESLLLDSLLLLNDQSATIENLLSSMKSNPFINASDSSCLLSVDMKDRLHSQAIENVLHYYLSSNPHKNFSITWNQQTLQYSLCIPQSTVCYKHSKCLNRRRPSRSSSLRPLHSSLATFAPSAPSALLAAAGSSVNLDSLATRSL